MSAWIIQNVITKHQTSASSHDKYSNNLNLHFLHISASFITLICISMMRALRHWGTEALRHWATEPLRHWGTEALSHWGTEAWDIKWKERWEDEKNKVWRNPSEYCFTAPWQQMLFISRYQYLYWWGSGWPLMECDNTTTGRRAQWHTPVIIVTVVNILSSSRQILMTLRIV